MCLLCGCLIWYVQGLVCLMCSLHSVSCAVCSVCYVQSSFVLCAVCSHEPRRFDPSMPGFARVGRCARFGVQHQDMTEFWDLSNNSLFSRKNLLTNKFLRYIHIYICMCTYLCLHISKDFECFLGGFHIRFARPPESFKRQPANGFDDFCTSQIDRFWKQIKDREMERLSLMRFHHFHCFS